MTGVRYKHTATPGSATRAHPLVRAHASLVQFQENNEKHGALRGNRAFPRPHSTRVRRIERGWLVIPQGIRSTCTTPAPTRPPPPPLSSHLPAALGKQQGLAIKGPGPPVVRASRVGSSVRVRGGGLEGYCGRLALTASPLCDARWPHSSLRAPLPVPVHVHHIVAQARGRRYRARRKQRRLT
jgi:hypothetical protein